MKIGKPKKSTRTGRSKARFAGERTADGKLRDTESGYSRDDELNESADLYQHRELKVDPGQTHMRIDQYLVHHFKKSSRSQIKKAALAGCLQVNGQVVKASYKVRPGDKIALLLPYPPPPDLRAENIPVDIRYEDDDLLIVHKPAGLVVHPGIGNWTGTLVHALIFHLNGSTRKLEPDEIQYPALVHRIDKDTSGLLVVAKTEEAVMHLGKQFYNHSCDRNYFAVVWGDVEKDSGTVTGLIGRDPTDRKKYTVTDDKEKGKHSVTHYEVVERFGIATLVKCTLETGRTHQIRVHMKHLGHTLFGDRFYGGDQILRGNPKKIGYQLFIRKCLHIMRRQALHAANLGFNHPGTGKRVFFEADLPEDFLRLLELLREYAKNPDFVPLD